MKTSPIHSHRRGFTLIELMVAMSITAIIVGVLVTITGSAIDTWNRSRNELRAARQAESMINVMTKDLESLVVRSDMTQEWLSAITETPDEGGSTNAARLIFFTAATDRYDGKIGTNEDLGGDVSCVGYRLDWKDPVSDPDSDQPEFDTFVINRHFVNPDETFEFLLGEFDPNDDLATSLDSTFANRYGDGTNEDDRVIQNRNFVCENVYQFTLVFHIQTVDSNGDLQTRLVSLTPGTSDDNSKTSIRVLNNSIVTDDDDVELQNGVLTAVEVALTVLTDSGTAQLRNKIRQNSNWPETSEFAEWLPRNSYSFSRLIQVPRK